MAAPPIAHLELSGTENWEVSPMPHLAVVILQEWFYNTLRELSVEENTSTIPVLRVNAGVGGMTVQTPLALEEKHIRTLESKPEKHMDFVFAGMGLRLIRNLMYFGYRRRPRVEYADPDRGTCVVFGFPMRKARHREPGVRA